MDDMDNDNTFQKYALTIHVTPSQDVIDASPSTAALVMAEVIIITDTELRNLNGAINAMSQSGIPVSVKRNDDNTSPELWSADIAGKQKDFVNALASTASVVSMLITSIIPEMPIGVHLVLERFNPNENGQIE